MAFHQIKFIKIFFGLTFLFLYFLVHVMSNQIEIWLLFSRPIALNLFALENLFIFLVQTEEV